MRGIDAMYSPNCVSYANEIDHTIMSNFILYIQKRSHTEWRVKQTCICKQTKTTPNIIQIS